MAKSDSSNPTPKRRKRKAAPKRTKKARGGPAIVSQDVPVEAAMQPDDETVLDVVIEDGVQLIPRVDPETGALEIPHEDGSILVDFTPEIEPDIDATQHDVNLALKLDSWALSGIAEDLLDGIASDDESRSDWIEQRTRGIDLLGLKLEQPRSGAST
jgi:hypothetical protein